MYIYIYIYNFGSRLPGLDNQKHSQGISDRVRAQTLHSSNPILAISLYPLDHSAKPSGDLDWQ